MEPTDRAPDNPAHFAPAAAVRLAMLGDARLDLFASQQDAVHLGVAGTVSVKAAGALDQSAGLAAHGWDSVYQRDPLGHIVPVCAGELAGQQDSIGTGDDVIFAAFLAPVGRVRPRPVRQQPPAPMS
jgi:hypothetical protein